MFERILKLSIQNRWLILLATGAVASLGLYSFQRLPIDAVPDITNVQVQINTAVPGYSPLEAEQRVTFPIETVMAGLPGLEQTRSLSRYGLSQVTVIFKDGTDIYFARQLISQRIQEAKGRLPPGLEPAARQPDSCQSTIDPLQRARSRAPLVICSPCRMRRLRTGSPPPILAIRGAGISLCASLILRWTQDNVRCTRTLPVDIVDGNGSPAVDWLPWANPLPAG